MPFVKVKRKGRTMFRGPSGRTFNKAQLRRYYARGHKFDAVATCGCGQSHQQGFFCDAAKVTQSDPTGTLSIRRGFAREFDRRWRLVKQAVNVTLRDNDQFGLNPQSTIAVQVISSEGGRLKAFQTWFDAILSTYVLGDHGAWVATPVIRGYERGWGRAMRMTTGEAVKSSVERSQLIVASTVIEMQGVMEAVSQQALRAFNAVLLSGSSPREAAYLVNKVVDDTGVLRSHAVASFMTVQAHATGTLDGLEARGVKRVGLEPEYHKVARVSDAGFDPSQPRGPDGKWSETGAGITAFHGAPSSALRPILEQGFKLNNYDYRGHAVFVTNSKKEALRHVEERIGLDDTDDVPVIFKLNIPKSEWPTFKTDTEQKNAAFRNRAIPKEWIKDVTINGKTFYPDVRNYEYMLRKDADVDVFETYFVLVLPADRIVQDAPRKRPTARQQKLFERRENKLNRLGLVNVETAGDEKVCPKCEQIEEEGPYSIDEARTLVPQHPGCRCAFSPVEDQTEDAGG